MSYLHSKYIFTSLTRIADLQEKPFQVRKMEREYWATGDYVLTQVTNPDGGFRAELPNGRMMDLMESDLLIGALGHRYATLEATGAWEAVEEDGQMHLLTGAGLLGKVTSKSFIFPSLIELKYAGHLLQGERKICMKDFVPVIEEKELSIPVVLIVGTSMSAGKTTAARIITRQLVHQGYKVLGAKLSGAGRYRDILSVKDAGADYIFDFVDVGLPSSIVPEKEYLSRIRTLISMMAGTDADIAVVEIGSSPLEPYNGNLAIRSIAKHIRCVVLCAFDPYAVYGVMKSFNMRPDVVSGPATNTLGGKDLIEKLCGVKALNIVDPKEWPALQEILFERLELEAVGF